MTNATLDRLLAVLVSAVVATGLLTLRAGSPELAVVYAGHGVLAWTLAAAVALKLVRSVPRATAARRWGRLATAAAVAALASAAIAGGVLWATSGEILAFGGWTLLTLHAYAGLALLPLLLAHLVPRRWRLLWPGRWLRSWLVRAASPFLLVRRRPPALERQQVRDRQSASGLPRRSLLVGGALALVGLSGWGAAGLVEALRGGTRRFTGSRWLPAGGIPPATTFFGEPTPSIERDEWRLTVRGLVGRRSVYRLAELLAMPRSDARAVLDCTSGWAIDTTWTGIRLAELLARASPFPEASRVDVRSVTGWTTTLSLDEARATLLATHVAGQPLPAGNGAPCRLVVPDRRGLDWVKWVAEIVVA